MSLARPAARACSCSMTARGPCAGSAACAVTARTGPPRETEVIGDPAGDRRSTQDGDTRPADGDATRAVRGPADRGRARGLRAAGAAPTYGRQHGEEWNRSSCRAGTRWPRSAPPCAERARVLRAAQCREGWHLDHEPVIDPDDPDDWQRWLVEKRAETQAERDQAGDQAEDTAELDALNGELDEEITRSGVRGKVLPARPARRHRSTRRRQDAPDLPRRKVAARTVGKTYTAPDGTTFRPSMFVTLTCPSYGRVGSDGTPPTWTATTTAGPPGTRCTSRRCSTASSRTFAGSSAMTSNTSPPWNRSGGWPRTSISRCAAPCPGPSCARCSPPPTTRCGGRTRRSPFP